MKLPSCPNCNEPIAVWRKIFMAPTAAFHCSKCGAKIKANESRYMLGVVPGIFLMLPAARLYEGESAYIWIPLAGLAIFSMLYIFLFYVNYELKD